MNLTTKYWSIRALLLRLMRIFDMPQTAPRNLGLSSYANKPTCPINNIHTAQILGAGSTIGPMTSARLGINTVDVGCPMWAMHSIRESAGVQDHQYITQVFTQFFS